MIRAFIVDDEKNAITALNKTLETFFPNVEVVGTAQDAKSAFDKLGQLSIELLFLDVEMGAESGFNLLEKFERINFHVVFITAHEEFALKAIKFSALDYIIKPPSITELKTLISRIEDQPISGTGNQKIEQMFGNFLNANKGDHKITIPIATGYEFVPIDEIYYLKASTSYTEFYLANGNKLIATKNLKHFGSSLDGYNFFRIHNSTIINLKYVRQIHKSDGGYVMMQDGTELSIAKSRKEEFMKCLSLR